MKVWILLEDIDYEGSYVCGVYGTHELAEQAKEHSNEKNDIPFMRYHIEEHDVRS